jgi:protein involved in polysaccharide export with SLBB domain
MRIEMPGRTPIPTDRSSFAQAYFAPSGRATRDDILDALAAAGGLTGRNARDELERVERNDPADGQAHWLFGCSSAGRARRETRPSR